MISPHGPNRYMIIDGERRWRASQLAEQQNIPAVIKRNISDNAREDMQLLSFFSRVDLNPVEMANALELFIQKRGGEAKAAAAELGVSEGWMSQRRKILKLPQDVQALAIEGVIKDRQTLNKLGDYPDEERSQVIDKIRNGEFNSSELVKPKEDNTKKKKKQNTQKDPNIVRLENLLRVKTGTDFTFRHNERKGTGSVTFHYTSLDHLDGLLQYFQIERDE
jgi:ParB family chromosome partitioning protein